MQAQTRVACAEDVETIFEIIDAAFKLAERPEKRSAARRMAESGFPNFLLLEDEGRAVGAVHIAQHHLQIGRAVILKGDVGHVAIRPEWQGKGYGTTMMQQTVEHMRENGLHLSRLGGSMRFYSRFGYEPFLRRYINIPVEPMDSDLKGRQWVEIRAIPQELSARVRRYHPSRDHSAVHALRRAFDHGRPGAHVIGEPGPTPTAGPDPKGLTFVYEEAGAIRGYLKGATGLVHAKDKAESCRLDDFAMDFDYPQACEALLKTLIWEAAKIAPTVISARLPYDERLFAAITAADIAFDVAEMHPAADGNMMQVLDLPALLDTMSTELSVRLVRAETHLWEGCLDFVMLGQSGRLRASKRGVAFADDGQPDACVTTDHATFLKWLFGISGFAEFADSFPDLTPAQRLLLSVLFPRLPCASGPWG